MSTDHRADAVRALRRLPAADVGAETLTGASEATAHALLAIEARLGELLAEQRMANTIAAYEARVIEGDNEYRQARDTVRAVLGLADNPEGRSE
ncbi:hypothetical protein D5S18_18500 [Nocardia panacis]|uniref:Uncharacterized protein n=1 Tax=Nocardia panacis TaxID=2340916 RepID=A0A3A4KMC0_9NOCA|nr:hypothetical protein [Nocardia panacis]RJO74144.1 hypothetical protein D5S18_18500 [Nocardia panacis]